MTRFPFMLLVVGLACILVVVGCGDGDGSPTVTVTPKSARDLPTATPMVVMPIATDARLHGALPFVDGDPDPVPTFERLEPLFVPRGPGHVGPHDCGDFDTWREANDRFIAAGGLRETRIDLTPMQTVSRVRPCVSRSPTDNSAGRLGHGAQADGTLSFCGSFDIGRSSADCRCPVRPLELTALVNAHSSEVHWTRQQASAMSGAGLQALYRRVKAYTSWELGFKQSSFHRIVRALRNRPYNAFRP